MIAAHLDTVTLRKLAPEAVFILPIAAIEQHGPHLPVGTDWLIASHIGQEVERRMREQVVLYPCMPFGSSDHHNPFAGTMSLRADHFTQVMVDLLETMIGWGARRILLLNSHGGNMTPGKQALNLVAAKRPKEVWCVLINYPDLAGKTFAGAPPMVTAALSHACEYETSMIQAIVPEAVHLDRYKGHREPAANKYIGWHDEKPSAVAYGAMTEWITSNGVSGDPRTANAEKGKHLIEAAVSSMVTFIEDFRGWPFPRDMRED